MVPFKSESRNVRTRYDVIPPDHALTRPARKPFPRPANEIVDAEFEVLGAAAKRQDHKTFNDNRRSDTDRPATEPRVHFGMASAGSTAKAAAGAVSKLPGRGLAGLVAVALLTVALAVHFGPGSFASSKSGLVISNVRQWPIDSNGLRVIELTGDVENLSRAALPLPALIAEMKSETGAVNQSAISLGDGLLAAGETARFTLRIPSPGGKRQEVSISFAGKGV